MFLQRLSPEAVNNWVEAYKIAGGIKMTTKRWILIGEIDSEFPTMEAYLDHCKEQEKKKVHCTGCFDPNCGRSERTLIFKTLDSFLEDMSLEYIVKQLLRWIIESGIE